MSGRRLRPALPAAVAAALAVLGPAVPAQQPGKPPAWPPINPAAARLDQTIEGLDGPGFAVAGTPAAGLIFAACEDDTIHCWQRDVLLGVRGGRGTCNVLRGHRGPVLDLAWNGGPLLASAGVDHRILLWSVAEGRVRHTLPADQVVRALAMSPDGALLASGGDDPAVHLWETASGKLKTKLPGHTDWVLCLTFSPDGKHLASAGYDGVVRLWDPAGGKKVRDLKAEGKPAPNAAPEPVIYWSLAFSPDGKELAAGTAAGVIHVFSAADGKLLRALTGHTSAVTGLQFHPAGAVLASASRDRTLRLWNPTNGQMLKALEGHTAWVQDVTFVAQGTRLASVGADRTVRLWDLAGPK
jgi:WD40 repeat protein